MRTVHALKPVSTLVIFITLSLIPGASKAGILFDARMDYWTEYQSDSVDTADLDGDGNGDLALLTEGYATIMLGRGNGTFEDEAKYWVSGRSQTVTIGDLDLDGSPDLAVVYSRTLSSPPVGGVAVLLGNGDGTFQDPVKYSAGINSLSAAIGDFNEDGRPDLAVAFLGDSPDPGGVAVLAGTGEGTFKDAVFFTGTTEPSSIDSGDLDGDGHQDLAAVNYESDNVSVLLGNGDGTFQSVAHFVAGEGPTSIAIHDLDSDGTPDLATANGESDNVSVLLGNGDGTFHTAQNYPTGANPKTVSIEDLDSDGTPDLAVVTSSYDGASVLLGHGDGTFQTAVNYWLGCGAHSGATGDLNGDGTPDLVTTNSGIFPAHNGGVSILLGAGDGTFRVASGYETGTRPYSIATEDLNRDGTADLAVAFLGPIPPEESGVSILLGNGNGTFSDKVNITVDAGPYSVAADDLDRDGTADLAVACPSSDNVFVLLGNGDGTFQDVVSYPANDSPKSIAIDDLNGDDIPDLVVANSASDDVSVLLGIGNGTFQNAVNHQVGNWPQSVAIGDLNRDDIPDLVVANSSDHNISVLLGNGDATFQDEVIYGSPNTPIQVGIGDFNGDSNPDLAVLNQGTNDVSVRLGVGDGTFLQTTRYDVDEYPTSIAIGTINHDGSPDLVITNSSGNNISVLEGNGDGTFGPAKNYGAGGRPKAVTIEDLDGDNDLDLAVANSDSNDVSVLFNIAHSDRLVVVGPGPALANRPLVRGFPPRQNATHIYEFPAYGPDRYGVNVSCGDVTGDGAADILTGAGPGEIYGPHVRGFQMDGTPLPGLSFFAYGTNKYGVNVAAGDLDDDGYDEIITGAGPGAVFGPHVRAFDYDGSPGVEPVPGVSYFAYGTPKWGVNVSAGDIDGDGYDEIVTGAGPGAVYGPHVRGWNVDGGAAAAMPGVSFLAYGTNKYGVNVTCGDLDGDGIDEIVTGAGPGAVFGAHVRGWNYDGVVLSAISGISFFAWDPGEVRYGATVFAGADLNDDGRTELVVGCGPDPETGAEVKVFEYDESEVILWFSLDAFSDMMYGVNVAAGRF